MFRVRATGLMPSLIVIALFALAGFGWVANIVKLIGMDFGAITGLLIVRAIGIFIAPPGAVMGYL